MKRYFLAFLFIFIAACRLPAQVVLNYQLESSSTITPHEGTKATGKSKHLTGSFSWYLLEPGTLGGGQTFILTNLSLFSESNSFTLDPASQFANFVANPPSHDADLTAILDFNGDTNNQIFLSGFGKGTYKGPDTAPTELKLTEGLGTNEAGWTNYVVINAKLIPEPIRPVLTNVASFDGINGSMSEASLVRGQDGSFYGTAVLGGTNDIGGIYKLTATNRLIEVASFKGTNGSTPQGGLILGKNGFFYGTTVSGGKFNDGTIFRLSLSGVISNVFYFNGNNGASPSAALVLGKDGNFYGTTYYGGSFNDGTIFKINPAGVLTTLVSFNGGNGSHPEAPLVQDKDGNFYGTTVYGGAFSRVGDSFSGWGSVFRMTPAGAISTIASFGGIDGAEPVAALTVTSSGELYGTTSWGGNNFDQAPFTGDGTIFRIGERGGIVTLHRFDENASDGFQPQFAQLIQNSSGNFYGTTFMGGQFDGGTIFQITPSGTLTTLISFVPELGGGPIGGLTPGQNATTYYGTTTSGGEFGEGTVYQLTIPNKSK